MQKLIFTNNVGPELDELLRKLNPSKLFVVTDSNVDRLAFPSLADESTMVAEATKIVVSPGDVNKNIDSLSQIWQALVDGGANRRSAVVCFGGGVITDMGGFAAATFKRGIPFINVPTTLLSAVDAAVGGKTGINFAGLKNEIGAFCNAEAVVISTRYFSTLPQNELLSGYAEMIKHALLTGSDAFNRLMAFELLNAPLASLLPLLEESVMVKKRIVDEDPTEHGLRKALNLGHTPGHAYESLAMERSRPVAHGYAVAWGLVTDLVLSHMQLGFPSDALHRLATFVAEHYGAPAIDCDDYPQLLQLMHHDKKNIDSNIRFTLLREPGAVELDATATDDEIRTALDITRDLLHAR